jgi:hypothetical protein
MPSTHEKPYVRLARPAEFDTIARLGQKAFNADPVLTYFNNVQDPVRSLLPLRTYFLTWYIPQASLSEPSTEEAFKAYVSFNVRSCYYMGGRVTVVVVPKKDGQGDSEEIVAAAAWLPPNKRPSLLNIITLLLSGFIGLLFSLGWTGFYVCAFRPDHSNFHH